MAGSYPSEHFADALPESPGKRAQGQVWDSKQAVVTTALEGCRE